MRWLLLVALVFSSASAAASPALDRAKREDAALRKDESKLRIRENITRVIDLWRSARDAAKTDAEKREAARGLIEAWALLAKWSGRADDAERAKRIAEQHRVHTLRSVRAQGTSLLLDASGEYEIQARTYGRHRLYFDLSPLVAVKEVLGEVKLEAKEIDLVRVTQYDADTVRIIFDFAGDIPSYATKDQRIDLKLSPLACRLSTCERSERPERSEPKGRSASSELETIVAEVKAEYGELEEEPRNETPPERSTRKPTRSRARSLLAIEKVVVDAGHGGRDTGAIGQKQVREKDVNLAIALKLGAELEKLGVKVVYTRKDDRFVSLEKRTMIANQSGADLFISIHANSNRSPRIHGIETYYLDTSSSRYASRLAKRENGLGGAPDLDPRDDSRAETELPDGALGADLRLILADLAMRSATAQSKRLAEYVQASMIRSLSREHRDVNDLGVKHALFAVLLGVRMPAVLIETGFVTNAMERERLTSSAYQAKLAKAIARGVARLKEERQELAVAR